MAGGMPYEKIPLMLKNNIETNCFHYCLQGPLEECGMPREIASWTVNNLSYVT